MSNRAVPRSPERPLSAPQLARLTERFLAIQETARVSMVEASVKMGEIVIAAQEGMRWSAYEEWVKKELRLNVPGAARLAGVARLARRHPRAFDRLKHRGATFLGDLGGLPEPAMARVLRDGFVRVPGRRKPADLMTVPSVPFREALRKLRPRAAYVNARARATSVLSHARRALERLDSLEGHWPRVKPELVSKVAAALADLCAAEKKRPWIL